MQTVTESQFISYVNIVGMKDTRTEASQLRNDGDSGGTTIIQTLTVAQCSYNENSGGGGIMKEVASDIMIVNGENCRAMMQILVIVHKINNGNGGGSGAIVTTSSVLQHGNDENSVWVSTTKNWW